MAIAFNGAKIKMKKILGLMVVFALTGCANSGVQSIGKDSYLVSVRVPFSGQSGAKADALTSANVHCASQGKQMMLGNISSSECALRGGCGEAQIIFSCLDKEDPRYQTSNLRKEPDTVIQVQPAK